MFRFYSKCLAKYPYTTNSITSASLVAMGDCLAQKLEYDACITKTQKWIANQSNNQSEDHFKLQTLSENFSFNRLAILSAWGGFFFSPYFVKLFRFLDSFPAIAAKTPRNIAIRVVSIYFIAQPLNVVLFPYKAIAEYYFPVNHPTFPLIQNSNLTSEPAVHDQSINQAIHHSVNQTIKAGALALACEGAAMPVPLSEHHPTHQPTDQSTTESSESAFESIKDQVVSDWQTKLPNVLYRAALVWGSWNTINMALVPPAYRVVASSWVSVGWNTWLSLYAHADLSEEAELSNEQSKETSVNQSSDRSVNQTSIADKIPKAVLA